MSHRKSATGSVSHPKTKPLPQPESTPFFLKMPLLWLAIAIIVVYLPSFSAGYTDLDDGINIHGKAAFNSQLSNLINAFRTSVLIDVASDIYYRPMHSISMILNYQLSGTNIGGYHAVNILIHMLAVWALHRFLLLLGIARLHAFLLSLFMAVHPALVMAVSWIPGRMDTILGLFSLLFLGQSVHYAQTGKPVSLALTGFYLLLAFFSKESTVFLLPAAFILHTLGRGEQWNSKRSLMQWGVWALCFVIWLGMRAMAAVAPMNMTMGEILKSMVSKLPAYIPYFGKAFLPIGLSVYPVPADAVYTWGILAAILIGVLVYFGHSPHKRMVWAGLAMFGFMMVPLLLIPDYIGHQTFEYRLYVPMTGLLLIIPETVLFRNKLSATTLGISGLAICILLAVLNVNHQKHFTDPYAFWSNAIEYSPHDSYVNMMMAAREPDSAVSRQYFERAFQLNPRERYVNYIYATMLQEKGKIAESEPYLKKEQEITGYNKCNLLLARIARQKEDFPGAIGYVNTYLKKEPADTMAQLNLLLLYMESDKDNDAVRQANKMDSMHFEIPPIIRSQIKY